MTRRILVEICYEINPLEKYEISTEKWNNLFPKLMKLEKVAYVLALPKDKGIDLTVGYNCMGEPSAEIINILEEKIKEDFYTVCFMQTRYAEEKE